MMNRLIGTALPVTTALLLLALGACTKERAAPSAERPAEVREPVAPPATPSSPAPPPPAPAGDPLIERLRKPGTATAVYAELRKTPATALERTLEALEHPRGNVRVQAGQILLLLNQKAKVHLDDPVIARVAKDLREERDADVRAQLIKSLGLTRDPRFGPAFLDLLKVDKAAAVRSAAAEALGRVRYKPAVEALVAALGDEATWVRMNAASALRRLKARSAVRHLIVLLSDENELVRQRAHRALQAITGKRLPADPAAWARHAR